MRAELRPGCAPRRSLADRAANRGCSSRAARSRARPGSITSSAATTSASGASKRPPGRSSTRSICGRRISGPTSITACAASASSRFDDAVADFRVCLAIEPASAVAHYNRALAYDALGRSQDAYRGYTRAIELDPALAPARLNRGIISYKDGRHAAAITDFEMGLQAAPDRETRGLLRFNLGLAQLGSGDRRSALANARIAVELGCREAKSLVDELR